MQVATITTNMEAQKQSTGLQALFTSVLCYSLKKGKPTLVFYPAYALGLLTLVRKSFTGYEAILKKESESRITSYKLNSFRINVSKPLVQTVQTN